MQAVYNNTKFSGIGNSMTERERSKSNPAAYLAPGKGFLTRRHTALVAREGMTATYLRYIHGQGQRSQQEHQVPTPPRFPRPEPDRSRSRSRSENVIKLGDIVLHHGNAGEVKFMGKLPNSPIEEEIFIGLEFPIPVGNSDGSYDGVRVFSTGRNYAGFYKASECIYRGESALNYLPKELTSQNPVNESNENFFTNEIHRLSEQVKHSERVLDGKDGSLVNPKLNVVNSFKAAPRYPNYLPELKAERKGNMPPASIVVTPYAAIRRDPSAQAQAQVQARNPPKSKSAKKSHNYFFYGKPRAQGGKTKSKSLPPARGHINRHVVNLYRASQKNAQAQAQAQGGAKKLDLGADSQPDSLTDMNATRNFDMWF